MKRVLLPALSQWDGTGLVSVLGPTGSGKSAAVLKRVGELWPQNPRLPLLVSVDAVAIFKDLDIGSAKPLGEERTNYDWAGLDLWEADARPTAMDYVEKVSPLILKALSQKRPVILVGGSHFYERALVDGPGAGDASDPRFQDSLEESSNEELYKRLLKCSPRWKERAHPNDRYRLKRFLDLAERQGLSFEELQGGQSVLPLESVNTVLMGVEVPPEVLEARLQKRIQQMWQEGWREEVEALLLKGVPADSPALRSVGYLEVTAWLMDGAPAQAGDALMQAILISHRQLAKKQRSWLRKLAR